MNKFWSGVLTAVFGGAVSYGLAHVVIQTREANEAYHSQMRDLETKWKGKRVQPKVGPPGYVREVHPEMARVRSIDKIDAPVDVLYYYWELTLIEEPEKGTP
jgi:hypothetical protein